MPVIFIKQFCAIFSLVLNVGVENHMTSMEELTKDVVIAGVLEIHAKFVEVGVS